MVGKPKRIQFFHILQITSPEHWCKFTLKIIQQILTEQVSLICHGQHRDVPYVEALYLGQQVEELFDIDNHGVGIDPVNVEKLQQEDCVISEVIGYLNINKKPSSRQLRNETYEYRQLIRECGRLQICSGRFCRVILSNDTTGCFAQV